MHSSSPPPRCAACPFKREERLCCVPGGKHPPDCPSAAHTDLVEKSRRTYAQPDIRAFRPPGRPGGAAQLRETARRAGACPAAPGSWKSWPLPGPWATIVWACSFVSACGARPRERRKSSRPRAWKQFPPFARRAGCPRASWASRARICSTRSSRKACAIPCSRPS